MYTIENYAGSVRFGSLYGEIHDFLRAAADKGYNEHFHWGRFDWMMTHPFLDADMLPKIGVFRDESGSIAGTALFDTGFDDRWYILHATDSEALLRCMLEYTAGSDMGSGTIKANLSDLSLCALLRSMGYQPQASETVLQMSLSHDLSYGMPDGFRVSSPGEEINRWQWKLVIHRGFHNEGEPEESGGDVAEAEKHLEASQYLKVFAVHHGEYAAHCGVWYDGGDTAYIEPVVTVPEHRRRGLAKAVVYEALSRAKMRGAKRAVVLSDQEFYTRIGMTVSSEVGAWTK